MTTYLNYNAVAANNNAAPPKGAPEGMAPSAVNDTMRDMMSVIRQLGDASVGGGALYGGTSGGSANAQTFTVDSMGSTYDFGRMYAFTAGFTNTSTVTININSKGFKALRKNNNQGISAGDISAGYSYLIQDVGEHFNLLNPQRNGSAASRDVGTGAGNIPEIVNGSGQFSGSIDAAHKTLDNLTGSGVQRTIWASISFAGGGGVVAAFNSTGVVRNGVGLYTVTFPGLVGNYHVAIDLDVPVSAIGNNANIVSGTRTATSVQISTMQGNSGMSAFDPDRVTVTISRIS